LPGEIPVTDLAGTTGLASLASVIAGAEIFCGVDTAAMHMADAVRTPCVALFGPTNPFHWRPRHTANIVLRSMTSEPFAPKQKGGPMTSISPDAVISAISEILGRFNV
jgi:ADP-heptose:LPS heptosyltransferase